MSLRIGILSTAHVHTGGYVHAVVANPESELTGIWDPETERGRAFAESANVPFVTKVNDLLDAVDAVVICSENVHHAEFIEISAAKRKHVLCEKPLGISEEHLERIRVAIKNAGVRLMTAFPCRFSPAFQSLKERVKSGEIGEITAICATNRGKCPKMWFIEKEKSGGGAMIDHVVHVTDLLRNLLGQEPQRVQAQIGNNVYGGDWDDTAMLTLEFPDGKFATLDSSWSRPANYRTWGDVTMTVVGEKGVIEMDMFGSAVSVYSSSGFQDSGYGANLDALMVGEFIDACLADREPSVTLFDGAQASRVAIAGYRSVATGQPVAV